MAETVCKRLHTNLQYHFSNKALKNIFDSLFYNPNIVNILQTVEKSCPHCILIQPSKFKSIIGSERSFISDIKPGLHWSIDTMQLNKSKNCPEAGYCAKALLLEVEISQ